MGSVAIFSVNAVFSVNAITTVLAIEIVHTLDGGISIIAVKVVHALYGSITICSVQAVRAVFSVLAVYTVKVVHAFDRRITILTIFAVLTVPTVKIVNALLRRISVLTRRQTEHQTHRIAVRLFFRSCGTVGGKRDRFDRHIFDAIDRTRRLLRCFCGTGRRPSRIFRRLRRLLCILAGSIPRVLCPLHGV